MKEVEYVNGWGKKFKVLYLEHTIEGEGKWVAELSQEALEMLLEHAGLYRVDE